MDGRCKTRVQLKPVWLRPAALAVVAALHGALLWILPAALPLTRGAAPTVEISIIPQGDPAREAAPLGSPEALAEAAPGRMIEAAPAATAQLSAQPVDPPVAMAARPAPFEPASPATPVEQVEPPTQDVVRHEPPGELSTPVDVATVALPAVTVPDPALPIPVQRPQAPVAQPQQPAGRPRRVEPPRPSPQEIRAAERRREIEHERAQQRAKEAARERREQRRAAQAREAERRAVGQHRQAAAAPAAPAAGLTAAVPARGLQQGGGGARQSVGNGQSGTYAAQVRAILQARANALGLEDVEGVVEISFSIGPSGRLVSHAISRPSGNFTIDRAIRSMLPSLSFPPPPGGSFAGNVIVRVR